MSCRIPSWKPRRWPSWEVSRHPVCAGSGPSWHRLEPRLWGSGQIPEVAVTARSRAAACPAAGHGSCAALGLPRPPSSPLRSLRASQHSGAGGGELWSARIWVAGKGGHCFSSPRAIAHTGGLALGQGGRESWDFAPLFLGKEHEQLCWAPSPPSCRSGSWSGCLRVTCSERTFPRFCRHGCC